MAKMTNEQAIHILMHIDAHVEHDEEFGIMLRAPLMDAALVAIKALKETPAEPLRARWACDDDDQGSWRCSHCGFEAMPADWFCTPYDEGMNFCPACGADMRRDAPAAACNKELEN